ncbi:MAG: hypothetical protein ACJ77K_16505 [Bacteroidia bacterium]
MEIIFPQYRKYKNEKSFFKITSRTEWEEIQQVGSKYVLSNYTVKIMPDRNLLHDMLFDYSASWVKIDANEYAKIKKKLN